MAVGDIKRMSEFDKKKGEGAYNLSTDVLKWVFITEGIGAIDANATAIGIANFTKVASAGNYTQDSSLTSVTWTRSAGVTKLDFADVSFAADGANPTTGKCVAVYDDTSTNKDVIAVIDITADGGTTAANTTLGFNWTVNAGGLITDTSNPV